MSTTASVPQFGEVPDGTVWQGPGPHSQKFLLRAIFSHASLEAPSPAWVALSWCLGGFPCHLYQEAAPLFLLN